MKYAIPLFLSILLSSCFGRAPEKTGNEGQLIPHFTILYPDSTTYYNTDHILPGSSTVFVFFGPHCVYSRALTTDIVESMKSMKSINFLFITNTNFEDMQQFYKEFKLKKISNIKIGYDYNNFFLNYFKATEVPYIAIYGKNNKLISAFEGRIPVKQIINCIQ